MKTIFDEFSSLTGWAASTGASVYGLNDSMIAGDLTYSTTLYFNAINSYCTKTYSTPISTTGYTDITFWIWSRNLGSNKYSKKTDFSYKIDFGTSKEYYIPCFETFGSVTISTEDITTIDRVRITALTATTDYLIISYGVLSVDELPLDIFVGLQEKISKDILDNYSKKYLIGTITGIQAGDLQLEFTGQVPWIDRYCSIMITDGTNTEYNKIEDKNNKIYKLRNAIVNNFSSADIYVFIPVVYGRRQIEIELPSISIWGIEPEKVLLGNQLENVLDSFKTDDTFRERKEGHFQKYGLIVETEAREDELLNFCSQVIRDNIGRLYMWVNGQKIDIEFNGVARETEPTEAFQIIPKVQYIADVTIKEELWKRVKLYKTNAATITVTPE